MSYYRTCTFNNKYEEKWSETHPSDRSLLYISSVFEKVPGVILGTRTRIPVDTNISRFITLYKNISQQKAHKKKEATYFASPVLIL
jgi:hypothetical protein